MTHHSYSQQPQPSSSLAFAARTGVGIRAKTLLLLVLAVLFVGPTTGQNAPLRSTATRTRTLSTQGVPALDGDLHFQTWSGHQYNFDGAHCDLVLLHSNKFAAGRGIDIHIRTTTRSSRSVPQQQQDSTNTEPFSYISGVAVRIGQDVLQVSSHGTYYLNGVPKRHGHNNSDDDSQTEVLAGFPIVHRPLEKDHYFYDITVESGDDANADTAVAGPIIIRLTSYQDICSVRILFGNSNDDENSNVIRDYYFGDAVGLLGRYESSSSSSSLSVGGDEMVARNGVTVLTDNPHAFGLEWQVRSSRNSSNNRDMIRGSDDDAFLEDPQLFPINADDSFPQYPETCIVASSTTTNTGAAAAVRVAEARHVRRRGTSKSS
jgi:hypothetical protein